MLTRILHIIIALTPVLSLFVTSCTGVSHHDKRVVSVTIQPQKYLAEQIAGEHFLINCVVPANSNPEAYDPTPMQLVEIDKSEAYLRVGGMLGFEMSWMDRLSQNNPDMKIYDTSEGVDMLTGTHCHTHGNGVVHACNVIDPHIWSSPRNVRIMARNICRALTEIDADNASYYRANCDKLIQRIDSVDAVVEELLAPCRGMAFAIYHPSLSYLARDYGLSQLCLENMGKENSAMALKNTVDEAIEHGVKVVFVQQEFNPRQVETFARELNAEVVTINPLNYDWATEIINIAHAIAR
ncbi:MAG: zinc ABC transporter substrate-binding protein [Bacteroidaceae bacterium]|nr:zinc ABC transporter substrate-binding protein [Bacteroidaceae bacterium]